MLSARELRFSWRSDLAPVVDGASLEVASGEVVGLLGPSGGGKTTFARLLGGYLRPQGGALTLDGRTPPDRGIHPVQVLFQAAEQAVNPRWKLHRTLTEAHRPDPALLAAFGVQPRLLDRFPHEVSGGELQRIAIVRALVPPLRVLVADEMTAMLDAVAQATIWRALLEVAAARRIAVVAISHDRALLDALGARVLRFAGGRIAPARDDRGGSERLHPADREVDTGRAGDQRREPPRAEGPAGEAV